MPYKDIEVKRAYGRAYMEEYRKRDGYKEGYREYQVSWYAKQKKETPELFMIRSAVSRARKKGLKFSITEKDIKVPKRCPIFGFELKFNKGHQKLNSPTLDRIDNTKGYVPGNVRVISCKANALKSDMKPKHIRRLLKYVEGKL